MDWSEAALRLPECKWQLTTGYLSTAKIVKDKLHMSRVVSMPRLSPRSGPGASGRHVSRSSPLPGAPVGGARVPGASAAPARLAVPSMWDALSPKAGTLGCARKLPRPPQSTGGGGVVQMVPQEGLEPPLPCENQILSLARLPVPPLGPEQDRFTLKRVDRIQRSKVKRESCSRSIHSARFALLWKPKSFHQERSRSALKSGAS